jgi:DNA-binding NtrC family response regulator
LDEVGDMSLAIQVKLLRVLEDRTFFRVGGTEPIRVDVRIIAASNRLLKEAVALGTFREDLYFRLNVLSIYLPPLRERKGDIPILVTRLVKQLSEEHNRSFRGITAEAMQLLVNAHWPGNVRQLKNLVESMVVLAPGQEIRASDIPADVREEGTRLLPMRVPERSHDVQGKELEFIFRSLVDLKLQIEELRRRIEHEPQPVEVIEVGERATYRDGATAVAIDLTERDKEKAIVQPVLYEPGMTMADVERAAIESALNDSRGNRRRTAEKLGIGERTLYRKIKEFGLG